MQVLVSFSAVLRFVLWLVVTGIIAGALLVGQADDAPAGHREAVPVSSADRR
jgi:hypothetical protein